MYIYQINNVPNLVKLVGTYITYTLPQPTLPVMLTGLGIGWMKTSGGGDKTTTWHQSMNSLTVDLSHIGSCELPV